MSDVTDRRGAIFAAVNPNVTFRMIQTDTTTRRQPRSGGRFMLCPLFDRYRSATDAAAIYSSKLWQRFLDKSKIRAFR